MATPLIHVRVDDKPLQDFVRHLTSGELQNAMRRAIDQSARAARKQTIPQIEAEIGVSKSRFAQSVPVVRATRPGDLSARWTISKAKIGVLQVKGAALGTSGGRTVKAVSGRYLTPLSKSNRNIGGGLRASTHRLTGGGSSHLEVRSAFFAVGPKGGGGVAVRVGKSRLPIKFVYAASPHTTMGQNGAAPRQRWEKIANAELAQRLPIELQKALNGQSGGSHGMD